MVSTEFWILIILEMVPVLVFSMAVSLLLQISTAYQSYLSYSLKIQPQLLLREQKVKLSTRKKRWESYFLFFEGPFWAIPSGEWISSFWIARTKMKEKRTAYSSKCRHFPADAAIFRQISGQMIRPINLQCTPENFDILRQLLILSSKCQHSLANTGTSNNKNADSLNVFSWSRVMADGWDCLRLPVFAEIIDSIDRNIQKLPEIFGICWRVMEVAKEWRRMPLFAVNNETSWPV